MFFVFIDFHRKGRPCLDCRGSLRRNVGVELRPQASERSHQGMDGSRPPRAPPRHATSGQFRTRELARSRNGGRQGVDDASTGAAAAYAF